MGRTHAPSLGQARTTSGTRAARYVHGDAGHGPLSGYLVPMVDDVFRSRGTRWRDTDCLGCRPQRHRAPRTEDDGCRRPGLRGHGSGVRDRPAHLGLTSCGWAKAMHIQCTRLREGAGSGEKRPGRTSRSATVSKLRPQATDGPRYGKRSWVQIPPPRQRNGCPRRWAPVLRCALGPPRPEVEPHDTQRGGLRAGRTPCFQRGPARHVHDLTGTGGKVRASERDRPDEHPVVSGHLFGDLSGQGVRQPFVPSGLTGQRRHRNPQPRYEERTRGPLVMAFRHRYRDRQRPARSEHDL